MSRRRQVTGPVNIVQPKRKPNEQPWLPPANYDCTEGHYVQADRALRRCPAYHLGQPCEGRLVPVGHGAKTTAVAS